MNNIKPVLESIYSDKELRRSIVPLFISNPGIGKSNIIEDFMREKGVWIPPFVLSQRLPYELSGMAMVDVEKDIMKYYDFDFLNDLKDGSILFIDEVTSANPMTLNAFLTFLESRVTVSGKKLPDIMIVAAGNPQGMTPLTPQIKERFVWYQTLFNQPLWIDYMMNKHSITKSIGIKLSRLIEKEDFTGNNFSTPRSIDKAIDMIIKNVHTPYISSLLPILQEPIENILDDIIIGEETIAKGEIKTWLELIQLKKKYSTVHCK